MTATLTLVQVQPLPDRDLAKLRRDRATAQLRENLVEVLELIGWQGTFEQIGYVLDGYAEESRGWCRDVWAERSKAVYELAEDRDLRGVE